MNKIEKLKKFILEVLNDSDTYVEGRLIKGLEEFFEEDSNSYVGIWGIVQMFQIVINNCEKDLDYYEDKQIDLESIEI